MKTEKEKIIAERVAGREEINSKAKERKRKPNFSVYEIGMITENVENHLETSQSQLTNNVTNIKKQEIWEEITWAVNVSGNSKPYGGWGERQVEKPSQYREKKVSELKREPRKNRGEPPQKPPSVSSNEIIVFEDKTCFIGLNGFETGI